MEAKLTFDFSRAQQAIQALEAIQEWLSEATQTSISDFYRAFLMGQAFELSTDALKRLKAQPTHPPITTPQPSSAESNPEPCQDPGCQYCVPEPEREPEPDALDLVEPATEIIARLVERLKLYGDMESLALATEGLTLLRVALGDYEPDGDGGDGDGDDGEPHTGGPSGLVVMVPAGILRGRGDQPA
jgi:hypothetical protein